MALEIGNELNVFCCTNDGLYLFIWNKFNSVSIQFGFDLLVDTYHFYLSLFVQLNHYQRDYWLVNYWLLSETKEIHFGLSMCFYWRGMHVRSKSFLMWFNPLAMTFQVKMFTFLNAHDSCSAKTTLWTLYLQNRKSLLDRSIFYSYFRIVDRSCCLAAWLQTNKVKF